MTCTTTTAEEREMRLAPHGFFTDADDESGVADRSVYRGPMTEAALEALGDELDAKWAAANN